MNAPATRRLITPDRAAERVLPTGTVLADRYEVRQLLGKGGFGIVYLMRDLRDDALYAFKTLREKHGASQTITERFRQEAHVWLTLDRHPNLVVAHFVETLENRLHLAMEYVEPDARGINSLQGYFASGPVRSDQILRWAVQISYGMEHAYAAGLQSHRDLKPSNILVAPNLQAKVTDLGLASVPGIKESFLEIDLCTYTDDFDHLTYTHPGQRMGTPTHMAPEQFSDAKQCDERSDIYSLGVILYQGITGGDLPFKAEMPDRTREGYARFFDEMRRLHQNAPLRMPPSMLSGIIERCLQKDPQDRYASFAALRTDAQAMLRRLVGAEEPAPILEPLVADELAQRGSSFIHLNKLDQAEEQFARAIEVDEGCTLAWNGRGLILQRRNQFHESLDHFSRAFQLDTRFVDARCNFGTTLGYLGEHRKAIESFEYALDVDWSYSPAWTNLGCSYFALGEFDRCINCYETALLFNREEMPLLVNSALVLSRVGRHQEALEHARQACELRADHAYPWAVYAHVAWYARAYSQAETHACRAVACDENSHYAWGMLGLVRLAMGRFEKAAIALGKAFELAPDQSIFSANRGITSYQLGREGETASHLRRATSLEPGDAVNWYNRGTLHLLLGDFTTARSFFDRSLSIADGVDHVHYSRALALHASCRYDEALESYDRSIGLGFRPRIADVNRDLCARRDRPRMRPMPSFRPSSIIRPLYHREFKRIVSN